MQPGRWVKTKKGKGRFSGLEKLAEPFRTFDFRTIVQGLFPKTPPKPTHPDQPKAACPGCDAF
jgi:hypothetical protein